MDGLLTTITSLPLYFAFIPLGVIFIVLLVLIVKSSITAPSVLPVAQQSTGDVPDQIPVVQTSVVSPPDQNQITTQNPSFVQVSQQSQPASVQPAQESLAQPLSTLPHVEPSPLPYPTPIPAPTYTPPTPSGVVPPVSSWKPVPQVPSSGNMGLTELQMQAEAAAHEKVTVAEPIPHSNVPLQSPSPTVVDVIAEPVVTPSATTPSTSTHLASHEELSQDATFVTHNQEDITKPQTPVSAQQQTVTTQTETITTEVSSGEPLAATAKVTGSQETITLPTEAIKA